MNREMKKRLILFIAILGGILGLPTSAAHPAEAPATSSWGDAAQRYDSLLAMWYDDNRQEAYERYLHDFIELDFDDDSLTVSADQLPDSVYQARLRMIASVIQLPYNDIVKRYIVAYTGRLKGQMQQMIGLAQYYFPLIEEELDRQGLPYELKILPMIESALQPTAISRAGAAGMWQFMLRTGKNMGLEVNSFVDQRMDPVASTRAACAYLKQLYDIYNDWTLAIAAYNCGPGNVNKALRRAPNAQTYWDIYDYLPRETRGYVPSFIAATYAYTFHRAHGIEPQLPAQPLSTDTITVRKMLHFDQIASTMELPTELLRRLNPQYKLDIIPATDKAYSLVLPMEFVGEYVEKEPEIQAKDSVYLKPYIDPDNFDPNRAPRNLTAASASGTTYKVQRNDVLGSIARRYGVTVSALMRANNISDARRLRAGQVLQIP
jgi:membrane-bound lytic murein transglycosylase D